MRMHFSLADSCQGVWYLCLLISAKSWLLPQLITAWACLSFGRCDETRYPIHSRIFQCLRVTPIVGKGIRGIS